MSHKLPTKSWGARERAGSWLCTGTQARLRLCLECESAQISHFTHLLLLTASDDDGTSTDIFSSAKKRWDFLQGETCTWWEHDGSLQWTCEKLVPGRVQICLKATMSKLFLEPNEPLGLDMSAVIRSTSSAPKQAKLVANMQASQATRWKWM